MIKVDCLKIALLPFPAEKNVWSEKPNLMVTSQKKFNNLLSQNCQELALCVKGKTELKQSSVPACISELLLQFPETTRVTSTVLPPQRSIDHKIDPNGYIISQD